MKFLALIIFSFTFSQAQKIEVREIKISDPETVLVQEAGDPYPTEDMSIPFAVVEQVPLFNSCEKIEKTLQRDCFQEEMKKHIEKHLKYPKEAKESKIETRVIVTFEIEKDGKLTNIRVRGKKSEYQSLFEEEAKRIINELPNFIPATQRGKIVKVTYGIPITFKL